MWLVREKVREPVAANNSVGVTWQLPLRQVPFAARSVCCFPCSFSCWIFGLGLGCLCFICSVVVSSYLFIFGCAGSSSLCEDFSLAAVSGGSPSLWRVGFSLAWLLLLWAQTAGHLDFSNCGTQA